MKQPSIQLAALASLIIHAAAFMLLMYVVKRQPQFNMPQAYTVNLVSALKTSAKNLPSKGEPVKAPEVKKPEPEPQVEDTDTRPVKKEPEKPSKTELKEPEVKKEVKLEKPAKKETKKPEKTLEKDKGTEPEKAKVKDKAKETEKANEKKDTPKPDEKPLKKETSKEDIGSVEERIAALKAKRKIQQHAMQRAVADIGRNAAKQGQHPAGTGEGAAPSTGNVISDEYAVLVSAHIKKRWVYPEAGKKGLLAVVTFTIKRNGQIENIKLEKKSGNVFYDRSALAAVTKSVPLPQPPYDNFEFGANFKDDF
ncbi:MAG: cell envelope integrity protein TolA [Nitrospirae bacterium YQR-1]